MERPTGGANTALVHESRVIAQGLTDAAYTCQDTMPAVAKRFEIAANIIARLIAALRRCEQRPA